MSGTGYADGMAMGPSLPGIVIAISSGNCPQCAGPMASRTADAHPGLGAVVPRRVWNCRWCRKWWGHNPDTGDSGWWPEGDPAPGWMVMR